MKSNINIKVLFENNNVLVIDKPAGWVVHGEIDEKNIGKYVANKYKKLVGVGEYPDRPGIVHRLDKDTTGCLLLAKNQTSFENLKHQFQTKKIKKEYIALVWGHLKHDTGIIDAPIARSKTDFRKKSTVTKVMVDEDVVSRDAREAMTRYKVLERKEVFGEKVTLVNFFPETGRTHQIRIHAKSIGHPIVGDHLYGPKREVFENKFFKNSKNKNKNNVRHLLHAKSISFFNPEKGDLLKVESPIPKDFGL